MVIYIVFIFTIISLVLLEKVGPFNPILIRRVCLLIIIIFSGFRYNVGWDYRAYSHIINYLRSYDVLIYDKGEILSNFLFRITTLFSTNLFFFLFSSFVIYFLIIKTIERYSPNYGLSLMFFLGFPLFYLNSLSVIRNFIAIAICFWAYKFIVEEKHFKYLMAIVIAFLFHKTALIALAILFLRKIRLTKITSIILVSSSFFTGFIFVKLLNFIHLPTYQSYFITLDEGINQGGTKSIFLLLLIFIIMVFLHDRDVNKEANFFYNCFVFGLFFYNSLLDMGTIAHRATLYLTIYGILALPEYLKMYGKEKILINYVAYCLFIVSFFYLIYSTRNVIDGPYLPYRLFPVFD